MTRNAVRRRSLVCLLLAAILLLPAWNGWALDDCCPAPEAAATAPSASVVPEAGGGSPADPADGAGPNHACSCAFCQLTLGIDVIPTLDRPGASQRIAVPPSRHLSSVFLSEVYRPPLA